MRPPRDVLAVDTSILIAAARGRSKGAIDIVTDYCALVTTDRAVQEARRRIEFGMRSPQILPALDDTLRDIHIVFASEIDAEIPLAEAVLRNAVASRNGSTADAHLLACAWRANADIWSHDRDFAATGVASWSTVNLILAVTPEPEQNE
jgi:predicted nucleic acid-binding protein